ncbi:MAG: ATP-dependent helicase [Acidimicrobiales bacterium]
MDPILNGLDAEQRAAVTAPVGLLSVLAGPGSGKTRVLTHRIAYRCESGTADASHVLASTFSRRAARELKQRLNHLGVGRKVVAGTFHGLALKQLKRHASDNDQKPPQLLQGRQRLLSSLVPDLESVAVRSISTEIDWAQARCINPDQYPDRAKAADRHPLVPLGQVADVSALYSDTKRNRRLLDFNDLLTQWTSLLHSDPVFSAAQRWRFRHLFIDEMQDLTPRQIALICALLDGRTDAFFVGDPDQAIYAFAGASADLDLTEKFPGIQQLTLTSNHRCSPQIVDASNALSSRSHQSSRPQGSQVVRHEVTRSKTPLVQCVLGARDPNTPWNEIAVLARTNAQISEAAERLKSAGVPVTVRPKASLFDPRSADNADSDANDGVQLATFHAAKGLEWSSVILHDVAATGPEPEERRLLFVAMTRATSKLTVLTHRTQDDWLPELGYSDPPVVEPAASAWQQEIERGRRLLATNADPLFSDIMEWREAVAHAARIMPTAVLTKERARRIAGRRPSSTEELAQLAGWGPAVESELAAGLLAVVRQSVSSSTTEV